MDFSDFICFLAVLMQVIVIFIENIEDTSV